MQCLSRSCALSLSLVLVAPATAQTIHIVDASGGGQFTSIQSAINAANSRDTLIVRSGNYQGFSLTKPLHILGQPGATINSGTATVGLAEMSDLPANTDTTVSGFDMSGSTNSLPSITLRNCDGRVLFENCTIRGQPGFAHSHQINDSDQVWFSGCTLQGGVYLRRSTAGFNDCTATGAIGTMTPVGSPAMTVDTSRAILSRCSLTGGDSVFDPPAPAMHAFNATLTITGDGSGCLKAGTTILFATTPVPAITSGGSTGTLSLDDDVVLVSYLGAPLVDPNITTTVTNIPSLTALGAPIGGEVIVDLYSEPQHFYYLFAGAPGSPTALPRQPVELWLALPSAVFAEGGILGASGRVTRGYAIPNLTELIGIPVAWQGATGLTDSATLSNADSYVHGM